MAPTGRKRARARTRARTSRKTQYKRAVVKPKSIKEAYSTIDQDFPSNSSASCDDSSRIAGLDFEGVDTSTSACSTPKAERFRIPEIQTCPPAPRKQRMISICSLQRRPIAFFAPPDLELFFFYALQV
ncbi:cyclin-dependent protein kinase inhibitor SMR9 [Populus alba x Populus x berolinensis]|uniref:Cyclin-dependent protein kinase inhibitor SMR9 n=1 Tax=Populus alba x Populus x berolinensis TaxID=444605 RepID=A0AAD6QC60_9ROSI|nr:cyclin-dependent protein kinase inhibitor SMR9 [Populus alba x Populus x berolinensis]